MSKDMLGSVVRAAVGVPQDRMNALAKLASAMAASASEGRAWHAHLKTLLQQGLPSSEGIAPTTFERNEYGHIVFTITGLDLTGAEEIERLETADYRIGGYARQMLTSTKGDSYDANHRLIAGRQYRIALLPGKHIVRDSDRTTNNLRAEGMKLGYGKPLAGVAPRIREVVSDKRMGEMGFEYIATLHDSITDADGFPGVLGASRRDSGRRLGGAWGRPGELWNDIGAFPFLLPAS